MFGAWGGGSQYQAALEHMRLDLDEPGDNRGGKRKG